MNDLSVCNYSNFSNDEGIFVPKLINIMTLTGSNETEITLS